MIRALRKNWTKFASFIAIASVCTFLVWYYSQRMLAPLAQSSPAAYSNVDYYRQVARYQIQLERLDNQLTRYGAGIDRDIDQLRLRQRVLDSEFSALSAEPARTAFVAAGIPSYRESMETLAEFTRELDRDLKTVQSHPELAARLAARLERIRDTVGALAGAARFVDTRRREAALADFSEKRRMLYAGALLLWAMLVVLVGLFVLNYFRAKHMEAQNAASLQAERRAEAALADAIFTKNTILGTISHELKTPLQTIISSIDLLVKRRTDQRDADVIKRLSSAAERMVAQMEDLTDYARLGAGKLELRKIEFDPGELIERVVHEFKEQALRGGLDLVVRRKKNALIVSSDARRIEQIAANLITNAIKYTPSGRIQVSMEMTSSGVEGLHLIVEDTGLGISQEKLHTLFEPFTQLDQGTTRKYDGAGMGLAIVRKLVDLFGGSIEVRSSVGRGTRFDVVLPVEIIASEAPPHEPCHTSEPERCRVLLVDDNAEVRVSMKDILTEIGYVCDVADGGKVALQMLATHSYDAILLDISMPDMDGYEVAAAVRGVPGRNRNIPIVALSAHAPETGSPQQRGHFSGHIAKPVRMETLRNVMENYLSPGNAS